MKFKSDRQRKAVMANLNRNRPNSSFKISVVKNPKKYTKFETGLSKNSAEIVAKRKESDFDNPKETKIVKSKRKDSYDVYTLKATAKTEKEKKIKIAIAQLIVSSPYIDRKKKEKMLREIR